LIAIDTSQQHETPSKIFDKIKENLLHIHKKIQRSTNCENEQTEALQ
jgi:hypothetical protein